MMDLVEKWSAFLPNTESISPTQLRAVSLGEVRELITEVQALRARVAELESMYEAACESWGEASDREQKTFESLLELTAQIAAHERVCAGTWVPVGERLPATYRMVNVLRGFPSLLPITEFGVVYNGWEFITSSTSRALPPVTHWLDAKLPTSSGEG